MNQKLFLSTCLILLSVSAFAQSHYFQKSLGATNIANSNDIAYSMYQTWDGGYIVCGSTQSYGAGSIDAYLAKFDSLGTQQWAKTYGTANWEATFKLIITIDSGYLFAGGVLDSTQTNQDVLLIKTDQNGVLQWSKKYGGIKSEAASVLESIQQTSDLGFVITGVSNGYDTVATNNIFLLKTDFAGDTLWTRTFTAPGFDQALSVQQTFDEGFIISGRTNSSGAGQMDALMIKTDSLGFITWANTYGGVEGEEGMSVKQTADSGYIVTGATYSFGAGYADIYITKTDANGTVQWSNAYGDASIEASYSIIQSQSGGYAVIGFTESFLSPNRYSNAQLSPQGDDSSNVLLLKIDSAGVIEWSKLYGGLLLDEAYGLSQSFDGGYNISAVTRSFGSDTTDNGYIIHTDVNGDIDCYSGDVIIQQNSAATLSYPVSFTYTWGFNYSSYNVNETTFLLQDNLLCLTVDVVEKDLNNSKITIAPNPVAEKCLISAPEFMNAHLVLCDIEGRILMQQEFNAQAEISSALLNAGVYLISITNATGKSTQVKLVKL